MLKSRLKVLLAEHDMTQSRLSEITGIRPGTITNIVNNTIKQMPVEAVCKICETLNCDIGDIFHYVPDKDE
ncbi:MAG TPA: helix-turn-helix transcriptional regulator [Candidatus Blautia faecipullorum]|nr:helix-turn-helix transcriptional regulator [Candidatus Blautia faecipullorum]